MSDETITISREQFERYLTSPRPEHASFDSLKAFVAKPQRREFILCNRVDGQGLSAVVLRGQASSYAGTHVREVLPDDLPPMTKNEAGMWVMEAWIKVSHPSSQDPLYNSFYKNFLKALGIEE